MKMDLKSVALISGETLVTNRDLVFRNRGLCVLFAFDRQTGCFSDLLCKTVSGPPRDQDVIETLNCGSRFSDIIAMTQDLEGITAFAESQTSTTPHYQQSKEQQRVTHG